MIQPSFSLVTFDDIPLLKKYIQTCQYQESNHNLINIFTWQTLFPVYKYINEHYVLLISKHKDLIFLYMPLCKPEYVDQALLEGRKLFKQAQIPFVMSTYTQAMKDHALTLFPTMHVCTARDSDDYVYEKEKLITLSGKKHQKRRNLYNKFLREYEGRVQLVAIHSRILEVCQFFMEHAEEVEDEYLHHERTGILHVLTHLDVFDHQGAALLIDQVVKGFIITSTIDEQMVQVNIEKADKSIPGIYQYMESEYFKMFYPDVQYINKEDDMGRPNLRKAKLANKPIKMITKYRLCEEVCDACKSESDQQE